MTYVRSITTLTWFWPKTENHDILTHSLKKHRNFASTNLPGYGQNYIWHVLKGDIRPKWSYWAFAPLPPANGSLNFRAEIKVTIGDIEKISEKNYSHQADCSSFGDWCAMIANEAMVGILVYFSFQSNKRIELSVIINFQAQIRGTVANLLYENIHVPNVVHSTARAPTETW